jgi:hypothetical protein
MVAQFRALGGVVENVRAVEGGLGLCSCDASKPVLARLPENLMLPCDETELRDGQLVVKHAASMAEAERNFFGRYQRAFSWGSARGSVCTEFVSEFDRLPSELRAHLARDFAMALPSEGTREDRIMTWFLNSGSIGWKGRRVLIPVLELAARAAEGLGYTAEPSALRIQGEVQSDILVGYGALDPLAVFSRFGVASPQPQAFSLPAEAQTGATHLDIGRQLGVQEKRGDFPVPRMRMEQDRILLSYLMVGDRNRQRLSRGIFHTLMREAGVRGADETFDVILHLNRNKFLGLVAQLEPHRGPLVSVLKRMARYQLEALAHCIGTREL